MNSAAGGASSGASGQLPHMPTHISPDFQLFELVHKDDFLSVIANPQALRSAHYEFLSQIRLTDYQSRFDTITVSERMVADAKGFFKLMATVTNERAFQEQLNFTNRSGRTQIDQPSWLDEFSCAYLTVWIAGLLEENLWAHYNFAHNVNTEKNVRKNDIANLFETRSETLQSQEVLSKHWHDMGNKGRQSLLAKLKQKAKEMPISVSSDYNQLFGAEQYFAFEQAYGSEFGGSPFGQDETSSFYANQISGLSRGAGYLNYNSMQQEEMASVLAGQAAATTNANGPPIHPFANQLVAGSAASSMGLRPYQFYHLGDVSIRPQYARMYQDLLARNEITNNASNNQTTTTGDSPASKTLAALGSQEQVSTPGGNSGSSLSAALTAAAAAKVKEPVVADPDLKYITSYIQQKEPIVSSMDVIKFLSETPLDEMSHFALPDKTRKNALCRELLTYIQDDLRNHIQNQLMIGADSNLGSSLTSQTSHNQGSNGNSNNNSKSSSGQANNNNQHSSSSSKGRGANIDSGKQQTSSFQQQLATGSSTYNVNNPQPNSSNSVPQIETHKSKHQSHQMNQNQQQQFVAGTSSSVSTAAQTGRKRKNKRRKNGGNAANQQQNQQQQSQGSTQQQPGPASQAKITPQVNQTSSATNFDSKDLQQLAPSNSKPSVRQSEAATNASGQFSSRSMQDKAQSSQQPGNKQAQRLNRGINAGDSSAQIADYLEDSTDSKSLQTQKISTAADNIMEDKVLTMSRSDEQLEVAVDRVSEVSLRSAGIKKHNNAHGGAEEGATLDTKTTTYDEAGCLTQSGSQSARKTGINHYSAGANLFQLTASQSVDLIKPSEQMRDKLDSKAHSTKSSANLSVTQNAAKSGNQQAIASKQAPLNTKKSAKDMSQQNGKKSNASSNSRGKNSGSGSRRGSSRDSSDDLAQKTFLVKEFIEQLIEKACEIADREEKKLGKKQQQSASSKQRSNQSSGKKQLSDNNLTKEQQEQLEETKATPSVPKQRAKNLTTTIVPEDLGAMLLARQESTKMMHHHHQHHAQKQLHKQSYSPVATKTHNTQATTSSSLTQVTPAQNSAATKQHLQYPSNVAKSTKKSSNSPRARQGAASAATGNEEINNGNNRNGNAAKGSQRAHHNSSNKRQQQSGNRLQTDKQNSDNSAAANKQSSPRQQEMIGNGAAQQNRNESPRNSKIEQMTANTVTTPKPKQQQQSQKSKTATNESSQNTQQTLDRAISEADSAQQTTGKKRKKRNNNRRNKQDAMNNFLLKMHGDGPSSSSTTIGINNSKGAVNNANNNRQGQKRQPGNTTEQQQHSHQNSIKKEGTTPQQSQSTKQQQNQQQKVSNAQKSVPSAGQASVDSSSSQQPSHRGDNNGAANSAAKAQTNVRNNQSTRAQNNKAQEEQKSSAQNRGATPVDNNSKANTSHLADDNLEECTSIDPQPTASFSLSEMQKYNSFTVNDSSPSDLLNIPSTISATDTAPEQHQEQIEKPSSTQEKEQQHLSSVRQPASSSTSSSQQPPQASIETNTTQQQVSPQHNSKSPQEPRNGGNPPRDGGKKQQAERGEAAGKSVADLTPQKILSEKQQTSIASEAMSQRAGAEKLTTKQKSADNPSAEKIVQLKVAESFTSSNKKLNSKQQQQIESAKADFRARFFELERQRTAEIQEQSSSLLKEELKVNTQAAEPVHKSEENVQVNIECLDSSASKQKSSEVEISSPIGKGNLTSTERASSDLGDQKQHTSAKANESGAATNAAADRDLEHESSEQSVNEQDLPDEESSKISVSEVSATTTENPFMSTKASAFMPTNFVPSPNKSVIIQPNQFGADFSPSSPLKAQNFISSMQQQVGAGGLGGIHRMPFKSLSVIEAPKDDIVGSARSNGSKEEPDGTGYLANSNPFRPSGHGHHQVPLGKQKSMQVGNFSARNHHNSFANEVAGSAGGAQPVNTHGFKIPDSSFTFQPHNTTIPFQASNSTFSQGQFNQMVHSMSVDDRGNEHGGFEQQQLPPRSSKHHSFKHVDGGSTLDGGTQPHKKGQKGPFTSKPLQKFNTLDRNSINNYVGGGEVLDSSSPAGGKSFNHKNAKAQYQAINRSNDRLSSQFGVEADVKQQLGTAGFGKGGGKNVNRMHLEFEQLGKDGRVQTSPLKGNTPNSSRQYSGDKKITNKKSSHLDQQYLKGPKSNRYKNNSKGSPDDEADYPSILSKQSQNSQDSQYTSGSQLPRNNPTMPLGQQNSSSGFPDANLAGWQTSPRGHNTFTPTAGFTNHYNSPMQSLPHMQFSSHSFGGSSKLSFGGNSFGNMMNTMSGSFQQAVGMGDDEFMHQTMSTPQLQVYGASPAYNTIDGSDHSGQVGSGGSQYMIKNQADLFHLQKLPKEEEIFAAAGLIASKVDFENLPIAEQDAQIDMQTKKQMEMDPVYKNLEDHFYRVFDEHILRHTSAISAKIQSFQAERTYVHDRIESMARDKLRCERIVVKDFGSLITGLALESSDMDMAITGLEISDRTTLIEDMHTLTSALDSWDLVQELKSIETASIPVIKAKIDLRQIRKLIKREQAEEAEAAKSEEKDEESKSSSKPEADPEEEESSEPHWLPIDITFDDSQPDTTTSSTSTFEPPNMMQSDPYGLSFGLGILGNLASNFNNQNGFGGFNTPKDTFGPPTAVAKTHLGMASCDLLKKYVESYPCLREVGILLKEFLSLHDLNSAYWGGISSYSAILLIVAYMKNFKLQQSRSLTPSRLLMGFLDFYSNCFDAKLYGINTLLDMSFYEQPPQSQQMFVIVDPVNPQNNTARNSHRTPDILKKFREAFTHLKSCIQGEYLRLQKLKQEQSKLSQEELAKAVQKSSAEESKSPRKEDAALAGSNEGEQQESAKQAEDGDQSSADGCKVAGKKALSDGGSDQGSSGSPQPAHQEQQQLQTAAEQTSSSQSAAATPFASMSLASSPQLVQAASFTPKKNFTSAFLIATTSSDSGAPSQQQQQVLEELPVKPFFFARLDLIEHLLSKRDEATGTAQPSSSNSQRQ